MTSKSPFSQTSNHEVGFLQIALRGIGQVMFQEHVGTGLFFLIGIAVASPMMALGAIIGTIIGPVVAFAMRFNSNDIRNGLYGFNPVLVGIAIMFHLKPVAALSWIFLVLGCVLATFLTHWMRKYLPFPTYTAPFIVATWIALIVVHAIAGEAINLKPAPVEYTPVGFLTELLRGEAEVMFGANVLTGILFIVGIALSNWRHASISLLGLVGGTLLAIYHNDPLGSIHIGIYGYNASLAAIAVYLWRESLLIPILAALISVPLTEFFPNQLGIPALTAPFVGAAWIVIAVGQLESPFVQQRPRAGG